jgi:hypothetical protein
MRQTAQNLLDREMDMTKLLGFSALALICAQVAACGGDSNVTYTTSCGALADGQRETRIRYKDPQVTAPQTCLQEEQQRTCMSGQFSEWSGTYSNDACRVDSKQSCGDKPHGFQETRRRYDVALAPADGQCNLEQQTRLCNDGTWSSWSGSYTHETCSIENKASCDGEPHGSTQNQTRYETTSVPFGSECKSETQTRACNNGVWTDWIGTFAELSCEVLGKASCGDKPHGSEETRQRYQAESVAYGALCQAETQVRKCDDGNWSMWSGEFTALTCEVQGAASCGNDPHGTAQERIRYEAASVEFGSACKQEAQTRQCDNGTWTKWSGEFSEIECDVKTAAACNGKPHGNEEKRTRYHEASVPFGAVCVSETQSRTCNNGDWTQWTGSYTAQNCTVSNGATCDGKAHGSEETRKRYASASVPFGELCTAEEQRRVCHNGTWLAWTGDFTYDECSANPPLSCDDTAHGQSETRIRYEQSEVAFGNVCKDESQERSCNNGQWSKWTGSYAEPTCSIAAPATCGGQPHDSLETRKRFEAESVPFGATCKEETQTRSCGNGSWSNWTGDFTFETCKVQPDTRPYTCTEATPYNRCGESSKAPPSLFKCNGVSARGTCSTSGAIGKCTVNSPNFKAVAYATPTADLTDAEVRAKHAAFCKSLWGFGTYEDM